MNAGALRGMLAACGVALALLFDGAASAQNYPGAPGGPPAGMWPSGMPNVAAVYYKFCLPGDLICTERQPQVWGQVCTIDHEHYAETVRPFGYHFVSWRCAVSGPVVGGIPTSGLAKSYLRAPAPPTVGRAR